jgi:hypothetical protein
VTLINLVLNLGVSFLPMVDLWAHLGGGIGGYLLSCLLIIEPSNVKVTKIKKYVFQILSVILCLLYTASIGSIFIINKPWEQRIKSPLVQVILPDVPFVVSMPQSLAEKPSPNNSANKASFLFGDLKYDPIAIELNFLFAPQIAKMGGNAWLSSQKGKLIADSSSNNEIRKSVDLRTLNGESVLFFQMPFSKEFSIFSFVIVRSEYVIKLGFMAHIGAKQKEIEELANKIISSIAKKGP